MVNFLNFMLLETCYELILVGDAIKNIQYHCCETKEEQALDKQVECSTIIDGYNPI